MKPPIILRKHFEAHGLKMFWIPFSFIQNRDIGFLGVRNRFSAGKIEE
jgi:hypothetical protein